MRHLHRCPFWWIIGCFLICCGRVEPGADRVGGMGHGSPRETHLAEVDPEPISGDFYVSSSSGSDENPGTEAEPWKTLGRVNRMTFAAPAHVWLMAGDVWHESLLPQGSGAFDEATFLATYDSTLNLQQAVCLAGSQFSDMQTILLAAGADSTTASDTATEWCRRLAVRAAMGAARDAADMTSSWITIDMYGTGPNPLIAPGESATVGIQFPLRDWTGGWKIRNVDVHDTTMYGIRAEVLVDHSPTGVVKGLWTENCHIDNVTGGVVKNPPKPYDLATASFCPVGLIATGIDYVFSRNDVITNTGSPRWITGDNYVLDENLTCDNSVTESNYYQFSSKVVVNGGRVTNLCNPPGYPYGGAGILLSNITDVVFDSVEIDNNHVSPDDGNPNHGDGVGVDFEDGVVNGTFKDCLVHDNSDGAFLFSRSGGHLNSGTMIVGCTLANNGTKSYAAAPVLVHHLLDSASDHAVFAKNTSRRGAAGQKLFAVGGPPGRLTDTPPPHWLYGTDNVVSFP
jgi:hypothetical protein